jgi:hypothetical protein
VEGLTDPGTPVSIPPVVHLVLWPALVVWVVFLVGRRRRRAWPCSLRVGALLVPVSLLADAAAFTAEARWPYPEAAGFVFALVWLAVTLSITTFFALRSPDDGRGGGDGDSAPEPPWWPEFEREFRDYTGGGRRPPPRAPAGVT